MQNGPRRMMRNNQPRPAGSSNVRGKRWTQNAPRQDHNGSQNARRNYERYIALAQAEALSGNVIGAENYYQHAEHYYRSMAADRDNS
jgi:hypothetical protein